MDWIDALILGIVQGLAEYLPISSSGHLEIFNSLLGSNLSGEDSLQFDVVLHVATVLSTIVVLWKKIRAAVHIIFHLQTRRQYYICVENPAVVHSCGNRWRLFQGSGGIVLRRQCRWRQQSAAGRHLSVCYGCASCLRILFSAHVLSCAQIAPAATSRGLMRLSSASVRPSPCCLA